MFGLGNVLWVPLMRVVGKRPIYLTALAGFVAANVWSTVATSWGSLLGGRMLAGFCGSAADAPVPSAVADMFYVDERGHCMMVMLPCTRSRFQRHPDLIVSQFFHLALASGIFLGPIINAYLVQRHSWRWSCGFLAIAGGIIFCFAFFLIRESQYRKERRQWAVEEVPHERRYREWLSLNVGLDHERPVHRFLLTFWDIIRMAFYPPVFWVGCLLGLFVGWTIVIQVTAAQIFARPPYHWKISSVGLFSLSGWVGVLLSFYVGGKLIDVIANRARRQEHVLKPKPEKRLVALVIPALIAPVGLIIYGQCLSHKTTWIGPAVGYALHSFGFTAVSNIGITYAVDCYENFAGEALVTVFVVRNLIAVMCSFYSNVWIQQDGLQSVRYEIPQRTQVETDGNTGH